MTETRQANDDAQDAEALELFSLEFEHQTRKRLLPDIKAHLDRKRATFEQELSHHPKAILEAARLAEMRAEYASRRERRQYVESGKAAEAAPQQGRTKRPSVQALALWLAQRWHARLVLTGS